VPRQTGLRRPSGLEHSALQQIAAYGLPLITQVTPKPCFAPVRVLETGRVRFPCTAYESGLLARPINGLRSPISAVHIPKGTDLRRATAARQGQIAG